MKYFFTFIAIVLLFAACNVSKTKSLTQPNIVIIFADDMGYGDVQALNENSKIPTPNLNRLASEGITFTDAHTASAVCTPSRYGLLTGRYCWRSRLKRGVQNGYGPQLIESSRATLASLVKQAGYTTGIVGKWHLGLGFQKDNNGEFDFSAPLTYSPNDAGFDYSYIIPASLDFPPYVYIENKTISEFPSIKEEKSGFPKYWRAGERSPGFNMEETLDHLLAKANGFIEKNAKTQKPFLLYFPLTAPHKPVYPHHRFVGKTGVGLYGDFVYQVDWTVGEVMKKLDDLGIAENTLLIYSSDNGSYMKRFLPGETDHVNDSTIQGFAADHHTPNYVYRGTKADIWEAGHHVPFFIRWPQKFKSDEKITNTICLTDVFATVAELLKLQKPSGSAQDSYSFLPLLNDKTESYSRAPVIHHSSGGMFAIRKGDWKLVLGNGSGGRELPKGKPFERPYQLFNMKDDIIESSEIISSQEKIAEDLEKECLQIIGNDL